MPEKLDLSATEDFFGLPRGCLVETSAKTYRYDPAFMVGIDISDGVETHVESVIKDGVWTVLACYEVIDGKPDADT